MRDAESENRVGRPRAIASIERRDGEIRGCISLAPATKFLCLGCHYEGREDSTGYICEDDAAAHAGHEDYGRLPLVNSPRSGVRGYDGPGEPPW